LLEDPQGNRPRRTRVAPAGEPQSLIAQESQSLSESGAGLAAGASIGTTSMPARSSHESRFPSGSPTCCTVTLQAQAISPALSPPPSSSILKPLDAPHALAAQSLVPPLSSAWSWFPRISRAQSMDALSSMATVAAIKPSSPPPTDCPRFFHAHDAAGTIPPAASLLSEQA